MKKLYLILLMLLIMFIPGTHAVAVYQLDQPISELNGYTLREVFEDSKITFEDINGWYQINPTSILSQSENNILFIHVGTTGTDGVYKNDMLVQNNDYYYNIRIKTSSTNNLHIGETINEINNGYSNKFVNITSNQNNGENTRLRIYQINMPTNATMEIEYLYVVNRTTLGISHLTVKQMDTYFNLYLEAVRFEQENIEASKDEGGYQNIFKSIINGVKGLMESMGDLWQFLNAPIITSDMQDYSFSVDWSWDLIGVVRQLISGLARLILQTNFIFINVLLSFTGIPIQVSLLTLLFSNFVFVILGWIIVKSFII